MPALRLMSAMVSLVSLVAILSGLPPKVVCSVKKATFGKVEAGMSRLPLSMRQSWGTPRSHLPVSPA